MIIVSPHVMILFSGEANAILAKANARAEAILKVSQSLSLKVATAVVGIIRSSYFILLPVFKAATYTILATYRIVYGRRIFTLAIENLKDVFTLHLVEFECWVWWIIQVSIYIYTQWTICIID
jgi:hypothetical protein